ncbi:MAG: radical SAM protein [Theionarchaea archaeon]|nr:radical SAM protein [Theionarchaea archaeon]
MKSITLVNFVPTLEGETTTPLGPLYVASILENAGCEVDFRDYQLVSNQNALTQKRILDFFSNAHNTVGVSCYFNTLPFVLLSLQEIKNQYPEKTIILGGPGPTSVADKIVQRFPFIDILVGGEGEHTILDLAKGVPKKDIKGITYQSDGKVIRNPPRERINLDTLPFPAYNKIDFSQYDTAGIITTRGCPYHCTFCEAAPLWGHHTERRSVSNVVSEIKMLHHQFGVKSIHINDDTFVLSRKWVLEFCNHLKTENLDITWRCLGRINLMDEDLISNMADAGCTGIQYGIESGSDRILNLIGKQITVQQIKKVMEMSVDYIENVSSSFIWGFPFETMDDFYETIFFMGIMADLGCHIKFFFLSPLPLSPLYKKYSSQLRFDEKYISNLLFGVVKDKIPPGEKEQLLQMIVQNPDIFSGFFYIHAPDVDKKYRVLKEAGLIH